MSAEPTDIRECVKNDVFKVSIKALEDRITHLANDTDADLGQVRKEINHKFGTIKQLIIWVGMALFGISGFLWNEHRLLREDMASHTHEALHRLDGYVETLLCHVFELC